MRWLRFLHELGPLAMYRTPGHRSPLPIYIKSRAKLLGQTSVLRPRQKTVLSLGHVNAKIKFTFTIGAGIPARPSRQYFAREPPCSKVFCTLTPVVTHYYGPDNPPTVRTLLLHDGRYHHQYPDHLPSCSSSPGYRVQLLAPRESVTKHKQ